MNSNIHRRLLRLEIVRELEAARAPEPDSYEAIRADALAAGMSGEEFDRVSAEMDTMSDDELWAIVSQAPGAMEDTRS